MSQYIRYSPTALSGGGGGGGGISGSGTSGQLSVFDGTSSITSFSSLSYSAPNLTLNANILPQDATYNLGDAGHRFNTSYVSTLLNVGNSGGGGAAFRIRLTSVGDDGPALILEKNGTQAILSYNDDDGVFRTNMLLVLASLGVSNSAPATTPGTVINKVEVFDNSGNSIGFAALYDTIT